MFLEDPPAWWRDQAAECLRQGSPERLVNPLANVTATALYGDPWRWREILSAVETRLHEMRRNLGAEGVGAM